VILEYWQSAILAKVKKVKVRLVKFWQELKSQCLGRGSDIQVYSKSWPNFFQCLALLDVEEVKRCEWQEEC
jgi:hypothetical protein